MNHLTNLMRWRQYVACDVYYVLAQQRRISGGWQRLSQIKTIAILRSGVLEYKRFGVDGPVIILPDFEQPFCGNDGNAFGHSTKRLACAYNFIGDKNGACFNVFDNFATHARDNLTIIHRTVEVDAGEHDVGLWGA